MIKRILFALILIAVPCAVSAQTTSAVALTITPPFFELNVNPGDSWASSIRVVNTNAADLPIRASVTGFAPSDDQGHGNFIDPSMLTNDPNALANWIVLSNPAVTVPRDGAIDVPFSITIPRDASPGGHYAAVMIGTAPTGGASGSHLGVSSFISALIFVRVSGDIKEAGSIEEFSTDHSSYESPDVQFALRFANTGNVHVRPVGQIQIYNAFGKERGKIDINQDGNLGYVLPSSTRRFDVAWHSDMSLLDIGQYTAVVTLAYGNNGEKSVSETTTFWILPIKNMIGWLLGGLLIGGLIVFILRRLIRKMLAREMSKYGGPTPPPAPHYNSSGANREQKKERSDNVIDLRR